MATDLVTVSTARITRNRSVAYHARFAQYSLAELSSSRELATAVRQAASSIVAECHRMGDWAMSLRGDTKVVATALSVLMAQGKLGYRVGSKTYMTGWAA